MYFAWHSFPTLHMAHLRVPGRRQLLTRAAPMEGPGPGWAGREAGLCALTGSGGA